MRWRENKSFHSSFSLIFFEWLDHLVVWLIVRLIDWLIDQLLCVQWINWLIDWLIDWLIALRSIDWLIDRSIDWLIDRLYQLCIQCSFLIFLQGTSIRFAHKRTRWSRVQYCGRRRRRRHFYLIHCPRRQLRSQRTVAKRYTCRPLSGIIIFVADTRCFSGIKRNII